jgi:hypothetical protein
VQAALARGPERLDLHLLTLCRSWPWLLNDGATSFRGAIFYRGAFGTFARLNKIAAVFEYDADASSKTETRVFEWR